MEKPWRSPRWHGRPNQQSSDDDGSDDEVNPQIKYAKKPQGKGRAFPPKKKAKTTKNTPVKDDSDDDYSSDDEETTFGSWIKIGTRRRLFLRKQWDDM